MKFQTKEYHTNQSSNVAGQSFQVAMSAKFFETLFSGLYRYKEAAALRELFCNAIDSHKMRDLAYGYMPQHYASVYAMQRHNVSPFLAEQNTPVHIHLPDELEPWLEIKDFGVGLSLESIMGEAITAHEGEVLIEGNVVVKEDEIPEGKGVIGEPGWYDGELVFRSPDNNEIIRKSGLYTTLFESTKANSNDQIGAFGLGSKSPFAVSDSFTVEARYNGEIHNFLMFLNAERIPTCELVTKDLETRDPQPIPTEECNGLTVRVPVKSTSYPAYAQELSDLCRVLLPHEYPEVSNETYFDGFTPISRDNRIFDTYIQKVERSSHASTHYAVMGGVAYPIELDQLDEESAGLLERFPSTYTFFPLGALNVPPSREDLSYDQFTKAALTEKMAELREGIMMQSIQEVRIAAAKGPLWLHMEKVRFSEIYGSGFKKLMDVEFPPDPRFSNKMLTVPSIKVELDVNSPHVRAANYDYMLGVGTGNKSLMMISRYDRYSKDEDAKFSISESADAIRQNKRPLVVMLDNLRCYSQKIKQLFERDPMVDNIWVVSPAANLVTYRDMELEKHYLNHKEIKDTLTKWVGTGDKLDYVQFADMFAEFYDGLVDPVVKFMSELPYEPLKIVGDIGMLEVSGYRRTGRYGNGALRLNGYSLKTDRILEIAESGKKIIYVEFSGHSIVHDDMTDSMAYDFHSALSSVQLTDPNAERGLIYLSEKMGWHNKICIVRKKAVPFLQQNPDFFVDINDAIKQVNELMRPIVEGLEYGRFSESGSVLSYYAGHINYLQWVMEKMGAQYEAREGNALDKLYARTFTMMKDLRDAARFAKDCRKKFTDAIREYGQAAYDASELHEALSDCRDLMVKKFKYNDMSPEFSKYRRIQPIYESMLRDVADMLNVHTSSLQASKNAPSGKPKRSNKISRSDRFNTQHENRYRVHTAIEAFMMLDFINTQYKAKMATNLNGADKIMKTVIRQFTQNARF